MQVEVELASDRVQAVIAGGPAVLRRSCFDESLEPCARDRPGDLRRIHPLDVGACPLGLGGCLLRMLPDPAHQLRGVIDVGLGPVPVAG